MKYFYLSTSICFWAAFVGWVSSGHHPSSEDVGEDIKSRARRYERSKMDEEASRSLKDTGGIFNALQVDRNFNSSFSLNIPLFTVTIPGHGRNSPGPTKLSSINIGNVALLGIVILGAFALFYPVVVTPFGRSFQQERSFTGRNGSGFFSNGLIGISEFVMSKVENSLDDLPSLPRLEPQECMKRSICEANHQPKKYGLMGLTIQLLFPPYTETTNPARVVSKYQLAARYGRQESANCAGQYDGCMFNFLDLMQTMLQTVFKF